VAERQTALYLSKSAKLAAGVRVLDRRSDVADGASSVLRACRAYQADDRQRYPTVAGCMVTWWHGAVALPLVAVTM
jgi:hypothetical protein